MHISDWKPPEMQKEAEARHRALLLLQATLLAAGAITFFAATTCHHASDRSACTAQPVLAPC